MAPHPVVQAVIDLSAGAIGNYSAVSHSLFSPASPNHSLALSDVAGDSDDSCVFPARFSLFPLTLLMLSGVYPCQALSLFTACCAQTFDFPVVYTQPFSVLVGRLLLLTVVSLSSSKGEQHVSSVGSL